MSQSIIQVTKYFYVQYYYSLILLGRDPRTLSHLSWCWILRNAVKIASAQAEPRFLLFCFLNGGNNPQVRVPWTPKSKHYHLTLSTATSSLRHTFFKSLTNLSTPQPRVLLGAISSGFCHPEIFFFYNFLVLWLFWLITDQFDIVLGSKWNTKNSYCAFAIQTDSVFAHETDLHYLEIFSECCITIFSTNWTLTIK